MRWHIMNKERELEVETSEVKAASRTTSASANAAMDIAAHTAQAAAGALDGIAQTLQQELKGIPHTDKE